MGFCVYLASFHSLSSIRKMQHDRVYYQCKLVVTNYSVYLLFKWPYTLFHTKMNKLMLAVVPKLRHASESSRELVKTDC